MLNRLLIGDVHQNGAEVRRILLNVKKLLVQLEQAAISLAREGHRRDGYELTVFGPYVGRTYLEAACTALLTRLDAFRVLTAYRHQESAYYEPKERNKTAIQWSGDIISEVKATDRPWAIDFQKPEYRALLGYWNEELVWIPAFELLSDNEEARNSSSTWISTLLKRDPSSFLKELRSQMVGLFSKLSKGVHAELVVDRQFMFDAVSLQSDFREISKAVSLLGLLSQCSPAFFGRIGTAKAVAIVERIEKGWT